MCDTKMEACNTTQIPMEANLKISKIEEEPEINVSGVEQKADILTRDHIRKMADVTRVIVAVSFSLRRGYRNLSEEVRRRFYKNWVNSKKRRYGSEERIQSNLEKDVIPMGGFTPWCGEEGLLDD